MCSSVANTICSYLGLPVKSLSGCSKKHIITAARCMYVSIMIDRGYSMQHLAEILNKNKTSVRYYVQQHRWRLQSGDYKYRKAYNTIEGIIKNNSNGSETT